MSDVMCDKNTNMTEVEVQCNMTWRHVHHLHSNFQHGRRWRCFLFKQGFSIVFTACGLMACDKVHKFTDKKRISKV